MQIHTAVPGDVYIDASGNLYEVEATIDEPSVRLKLISDNCTSSARNTIMGGVSGAMWRGFRRVVSREERIAKNT